jgi:hypothetical protein
MPSTLNQIFYNHNNKFDNISETSAIATDSVYVTSSRPLSITQFDDFMFTVTNKQKIMQSYSDINREASNIEAKTPEIINNVTTVKYPKTCANGSASHLAVTILGSKPSHIFYPEKEDSLFWCVYIAVNGHDEYMLIDKRYSNIELSEKQKMITTIRDRPKQLKQSNFKVTNVMIQEILSDLMVQKKSSLSTLLSMVIYYKRTVYIVCKNTYLYFCDTTEQSDQSDQSDQSVRSDPLILNRNINGEYGIDLSSKEEILKTVEHIKSTHFQLDHFVKPLKGVSTYKTSELHDIAKKLGLLESDYVKLKKGELYNKLNDECTW